MHGKRGRGETHGSGFEHEIDYAGLPRDVEEEGETALEARRAEVPLGPLALSLSNALRQKLAKTAQDEGVTVAQLAEELLAEGITLRAWEIIERKSAMRASNSQQAGGRQPPYQGNRRPQGNAWMEDKAAFLEYVRNQEKRRR